MSGAGLLMNWRTEWELFSWGPRVWPPWGEGEPAVWRARVCGYGERVGAPHCWCARGLRVHRRVLVLCGCPGTTVWGAVGRHARVWWACTLVKHAGGREVRVGCVVDLGV